MYAERMKPIRFQLGNVSSTGADLKDAAFTELQDRHKQNFIEYLKRLPFKDYSIDGAIMLLDDRLRLKISYGGASVDQAFRNSIERFYPGTRVETNGSVDIVTIPFAKKPSIVRKAASCCYEGGIISFLLFIMLLCLYIQAFNKPERYGAFFDLSHGGSVGY
jgi:hypothetical protein